MRRTVTLQIDATAFSKAFPSMTGEAAKETLVMLVCGGHAVRSHSACLSAVGIYPAERPSDPDVAESRLNAAVARAADGFIDAVALIRPSDILGALADRPKPGAKARARQTLMALLGAVHDLRKGVFYARPLELAASGDEPTEVSPHA